MARERDEHGRNRPPSKTADEGNGTSALRLERSSAPAKGSTGDGRRHESQKREGGGRERSPREGTVRNEALQNRGIR